jgi:hypothetical protein
MLHHPAEEGAVEAFGLKRQFIGRSLEQGDLT